MPIRTLFLLLLRAAFLGRQALVLENLALRQQLAVLKRKVPHPRLADRDRRFWLFMRSVHDRWRECLHLVQPETVIRWHRKGWRWYWRRKSKGRRPGRPAIDWALIHLIKRLARENDTWGSQQIVSQLAMLGHTVGSTTVWRYMRNVRHRGRGQRWMTFLRNTMKVTAACDFFVVPTVAFRNLYVFVVLSHDRRLIRHVAVTQHPTAEWTARQLKEAFPDDEPQYLIRDNDRIYGHAFTRMVGAMGIEDTPIGFQQPWMNCYVERVIGTIRQDCTDHLLVFNERQLLACLLEYVAFYNRERCHLSLDRNAPIARTPARTPAAEVHGTPVLGGLHHRYRAVA